MRDRRSAHAVDWRIAACAAWAACLPAGDGFARPGEAMVAAAADASPGSASTAIPRARASMTQKKARPAIARNVRVIPAGDEKSPVGTVDMRATSPLVSVTGTGRGQAGYVHFFIVRAPGEEWETQVGIETPDQRIAWSFFELGVVVSPFMQSGYLPANRKLIEVQYLYGVRPFPDEESMRVLRAELEARVLPWAEAETPYCILRGPSDEPCVSCLGFVLRILFPGATPAYAAVPRDFERALKSIYTTDDFLLYLAGMHGLPDRNARLKRVAELALPDNLREDMVRLVNTTDIADAEPAPAGKTPARGGRSAKPAAPSAAQPGKS
jgi:hypothetical protein